MGLWVCPQLCRGIFKWGGVSPEVYGQFACLPGSDNRRHFPSVLFVCLFSFPFLPLVSKVSLQREKLVPPAAAQVARQNYTYHLHLHLLCQKGHAGSLLDVWQSSITLSADTSLLCNLLGVQSTHFDCLDG